MTMANWLHPVHPSMKYSCYISETQMTLFHLVQAARHRRSRKVCHNEMLQELRRGEFTTRISVSLSVQLIFQKCHVITSLGLISMPSAAATVNCFKKFCCGRLFLFPLSYSFHIHLIAFLF